MWSYDSAPWLPPYPLPPSLPCKLSLSFSVILCVTGRAYWRERESGKGWARSQTIRPPESVVDLKSFNTLWCQRREELPWEANIDTADIAVVSRMVSKTFFRCPPLELSTCCLPSFFVISPAMSIYLSIRLPYFWYVLYINKNKKTEHVSIL